MTNSDESILRNVARALTGKKGEVKAVKDRGTSPKRTRPPIPTQFTQIPQEFLLALARHIKQDGESYGLDEWKSHTSIEHIDLGLDFLVTYLHLNQIKKQVGASQVEIDGLFLSAIYHLICAWILEVSSDIYVPKKEETK